MFSVQNFDFVQRSAFNAVCPDVVILRESGAF